ncbi:hypothetical protein ACHQM5_018532 [Ranunculus cassubicifolius]
MLCRKQSIITILLSINISSNHQYLYQDFFSMGGKRPKTIDRVVSWQIARKRMENERKERKIQERRAQRRREDRNLCGRDCWKLMEKVLGAVLVIVFVYFFSQAVEYVSATECNGESLLVPKMPGEKMGLPIIPPFCTQNGTVEGLLNGLSFGSSPATIINTGDLGFQSLNHDNNATGSVFQHATSGIRRKNSCRTFTKILVKQMIRAVKNPYNATARKIICLGIGPRECSPRAIWESYNSTSARNVSNCAEDINQLVLQFKHY